MCDVCIGKTNHEDELGNVAHIFPIIGKYYLQFENTEYGGHGLIEIDHCPFCGKELRNATE